MNRTPIEWTRTYKPDGTWEPGFTSNPIRARRRNGMGKPGHFCQKVSDGCSRCYSSDLQRRFQMPTFDKQTLDEIEPYLDQNELQRLLKRRKPCKVFLGDMTDIFGDWVPDEWLDQIFAVMHLTPHVTYQLLTKRADRMREYITSRPVDSAKPNQRVIANECGYSDMRYSVEWPLPNLWLGVSAENQEYADKRIPHLLQTPAAVRFVSYEPALGPVDLKNYLKADWMPDHIVRPGSVPVEYIPVIGLDWLIAGGESGPNARPCDLAWIRSIVEQCKAAGTACFVKQLGARPYVWDTYTDDKEASAPFRRYLNLKQNKKGGDPSEWPEDLRVREFPGEQT